VYYLGEKQKSIFLTLVKSWKKRTALSRKSPQLLNISLRNRKVITD